jgi:hypothetical protein
MSIIKTKKYSHYELQPKEVKDYFEKLCDEDLYKLTPLHFFNRVCKSILTNGYELTSQFYDVDIKKLQLII